MKEITLQVPKGKRAEWINGILTLVDEQKIDKFPITERIKTFKDAYNELGHNHPLCEEYYQIINLDCKVSKELIAYLKLRIITAALTNNKKRHLTTGDKWYPVVQFCRPKDKNNCWGSAFGLLLNISSDISANLDTLTNLYLRGQMLTNYNLL